jgi:hypothetical protein
MDYSNVCRSGEGNRKEGEDMVRNWMLKMSMWLTYNDCKKGREKK